MTARAATWVATVTAGLLVVPLLAMQFTDEVDWGVADFVLAGALLLGAGFGYQAVAARVETRARRVVVAVAVIAVAERKLFNSFIACAWPGRAPT